MLIKWVATDFNSLQRHWVRSLGKLVGNGRHRSTHQSKIQSKFRSTVQSRVQSPGVCTNPEIRFALAQFLSGGQYGEFDYFKLTRGWLTLTQVYIHVIGIIEVGILHKEVCEVKSQFLCVVAILCSKTRPVPITQPQRSGTEYILSADWAVLITWPWKASNKR